MSGLITWVGLTTWAAPTSFEKIILKHFKSKNDTEPIYTSKKPNMPQATPLYTYLWLSNWTNNNPWSSMENKSLSKNTSMTKHKNEQNCQHINKIQCPNNLKLVLQIRKKIYFCKDNEDKNFFPKGKNIYS